MNSGGASQKSSFHSNKDVVAGRRGLFQVTYQVDPDMNYFNTWLLVAEKVAALVDGIIFDPAIGDFTTVPTGSHPG